jgi:hypothetical protein|tara:strand:- start:71 stop:295 length:225 start_codon:yes stop_codon:yes gene_type:complete
MYKNYRKHKFSSIYEGFMFKFMSAIFANLWLLLGSIRHYLREWTNCVSLSNVQRGGGGGGGGGSGVTSGGVGGI